MRIVTVLRDGLSTKVVAAAIASLVAGALLRYGIHLEPAVDVALTAVITAIAAYLVPEKTAPAV